jgi:hypothetical protein
MTRNACGLACPSCAVISIREWSKRAFTEVDSTCTAALSPSRLLSVHERGCGHSECSHRFDGESHRVFFGKILDQLLVGIEM